MLLTTFIIVLLFIIALSNILDSAFPALPLSIIQIGLGVIIALTPLNVQITLQPEIFLGIFIAPLLYREAEEADLFSMWKVRRTVVFLVFGLVFATVMVIGYTADFFLVGVPLAACFCLGGILGPTDPIAVKSVYSRIDIDENDMNILKGESLINDASGVIAFSFAALALTTGEFSVVNMSLTFVYMCVVGLVIGVLIAALKNVVVRLLKHVQVQNVAAFVIIEMLVPFICFFVAQAVGASGILAAVAAGTRQALLVRRVEIFEARFAVTKRSLWDMVKGVFNSFIFILLGLELPQIVMSVYNDPTFSIGYAMGIAVLVTGVMFAIRFLGVVIAAREKHIKSARERLRNQVILTLSGVKGTVSLATAFALPLYITSGGFFAQRDLLLLITACTIIYSLIISNAILPIIAKTRVIKRKNENLIAVLREVVKRIEDEERGQHEAVVMRLKRRAIELEIEDGGRTEIRRYRRIKNDFFNTEMQIFEKKYYENAYSTEEFAAYARIQIRMIEIQNDPVFRRYLNRTISLMKRSGRKDIADVLTEADPSHPSVGKNRVRVIFQDVIDEVKDTMGKKLKGDDRRLLSRVVEERTGLVRTAFSYSRGERAENKRNVSNYHNLKKSYDLERAVIVEFLEAGRITEEEADDMKVQVNNLENFTIEEMQNDIAARLRITGTERRNRNRNRGKGSRGRDK